MVTVTNPTPSMDMDSDGSDVFDFMTALERAPRPEEPEITMEWARHQMSQDGAFGTFNTFYKNCREADSFYLGEFEFSVPKNGTKIRLGTAHSVIDTVVSHVVPQFVDISVPRPSSRGAARAERMEKFLTGAHHTSEQETPTLRDVIRHEALYGVAWEKTEFEGSRWAEFPEAPGEDEDGSAYRERVDDILEKRRIMWPVVSSAINPQTTVWDTNNGSRPRWIIHFYEADSTWIKAHFPDWSERIGDAKVPVWEVWTEAQVAYIANEKWAMRPREHGYERLPWSMYWPQKGLVTTGNKPEHLYRGLLHNYFDLLRGQSKLASHYIDIVSKSAWPTWTFQGPAGITEQLQSRWDDTPGAKNYLPMNVEVKTADFPRPPQEIIVAKEMLDQSIEETAPSVARGQRPVGAASGFHTAVLAGIAALNFGDVKFATERGLQHKNEIILSIVENVIRDRVTVWGRTESSVFDETISPKDIRGHTVNIVRLNSVSPEEQERKRNQAFSEWRGGFIDHGTALRNAGQTAPLEVLGNIMAEKFTNSEAVQMALAAMAAQRIPLIQGILEAGQQEFGSPESVDQIAQNILNSQGALQLPNAGNFSSGNQPPRDMGAQMGRQANTANVMPGSSDEAAMIARQIAGPRSGNVRVPSADLGPGGRLG